MQNESYIQTERWPIHWLTSQWLHTAPCLQMTAENFIWISHMGTKGIWDITHCLPQTHYSRELIGDGAAGTPC